jgi:multiple sugar transport system permease protein
LTSAISAYAFAKGRFPLKKPLFGILLMTMMIPAVITLAPSFMIYDMLRLTGTFFPLMVPGMFGAAACVFFMRQFYYGIPNELVEAAKIDGCNHLRIFFQIMVPLSKSALIAQLVLGFLAGYNDYFAPTLYLVNNPDLSTLQMVLGRMQSTWGGEWNVVMAGAVIALAPTIVLYFIAQKYFVEGIATSGMKL